jgi:hypothetical protein
MKNYFLILLLILIAAGCTKKQRDNRTVEYWNFSLPKSIDIETDCPFLTDDQFNRTILDTTKMLRLDRNTSIQIKKVTFKSLYNDEYENEDAMKFYDESGKKPYVFLLGKLNLQTGVNSLLILVPRGCFINTFEEALWLFNIKNNQLCSIVLLSCGGCCGYKNFSLCPFICVKNKILTQIRTEERYFWPVNFGHQIPMKDKEYFSTFKIDENGFLKFTK